MIVTTKDGRHRSVKTNDEKIKDRLLQWNSLSREEKDAVMRVLEEVSILADQANDGPFDSIDEFRGSSMVFNKLVSEQYSDRVVPVDEFILDEYFLGKVGKDLWPKWMEDLKELFKKGAKYNTVIITGSIGSGKTSCAEIGLCYVFYELCMLNNPQETYGLMSGDEIILVCFNRDKKLARDVTYGGVKRKLEQSAFFRDLGVKFGNSELRLPSKNISIIATSVRSADALGKNVFGGIIDETEFLEGSTLRGSGLSSPGEKQFAELLYDSITRRIKSRYEHMGVLPGKLFLSSSARHKDSFINKAIMESVSDPMVFCRDYSVYEIQPSERFSKKKFWVLVGNERIRSKILTDQEYDEMSSEEKVRLESAGCRFANVPENFRRDFERNLEDSIRDISGIVTASISPYIQLRHKIYEAVDNTLPVPTFKETWRTDEPSPIDWSAITREVKKKVGTRLEDAIEPRRHPDSPRHAHIDLSLGKTDACGICICHVAGMVEVERRSTEGVVSPEEAPLLEVDLVLRVEAPPNEEIDIGRVRGLLYDFIDHGFDVRFLSMDQFQSAESLQKVRAQGLIGEKISVDKTTEPYDFLKLALYEGRVSYYNYPIVLKELEQLVRNESRNRIEHTNTGTKDVSDSLAGSVFSLSTRPSYRAQIHFGLSIYDGEEDSSEWIRETMQGSKPGSVLQKAGDTSEHGNKVSGPIIFTG